MNIQEIKEWRRGCVPVEEYDSDYLDIIDTLLAKLADLQERYISKADALSGALVIIDRLQKRLEEVEND